MSGRLVCDTKISCRELIKSTTYELTELVKTQLDESRGDIEFAMIPGYYQCVGRGAFGCLYARADPVAVVFLP
jgi:hypothetical protein